MESMLDEDRKPRALFWWWFGGVAACLLLATGILGFYQFGNHQSITNTPLALNKTSNGNTETPTGFNTGTSTQNINSTNVNSTNNVTPLANSANQNDGSSNGNSVQSPKPASGSSTDKKLSSKTAQNLNASKAKSLRAQTVKPTTTVLAKSGNELSIRTKHNHKAKKSDSNVKSEALTANASTTLNGSNTNEVLAQSTGTNERAKLLDPISMDPILAFEFPSGNPNDEDNMKKKDDDDVNLKKLKKKFFVYSVGAAANITGTTLGYQTGATAADVFDHSPSYMVGLTHDFMFFKRLAITNSILFSQTSFKVLDAKTTYPTGLSSYSSNITELTIPIGVKAYAISKPKFRFYMAAGVINHIKLKETFNYQYNNAFNIFTGTGGLLPSQTQFTGNQDPAAFANSLSHSSYYSTYDVSLNHAKRYYASFYTSAGAEFIVQKHFVFFAESLFYMALQKVGVQDKYKYNLGLSGGFRYQF